MEEGKWEGDKGQGKRNGKGRRGVGRREGKGRKEGVNDEGMTQFTTDRLVRAGEEGTAPNILGHYTDLSRPHRSRDHSIPEVPFPIGAPL